MDTVLRAAASIESEENNWGSWGVFAGLAGAYWRDDPQDLALHAARLDELIDVQIDASGNLPAELARGERGLWYTYFSLAPLSHAADIVREATGQDRFPWQPPGGGSLEQALDAFLAAAEEAQGAGGDPSVTPSPSGWGGDLLFAAGSVQQQPQWQAWTDPPFGRGNAAWKTPDLLNLPEPPRAAGLVVACAALALLARRRSQGPPSGAKREPGA